MRKANNFKSLMVTGKIECKIRGRSPKRWAIIPNLRTIGDGPYQLEKQAF